MKAKKSLYDFLLGDLRIPLTMLSQQKERGLAYLIRKAVRMLLIKEGILKEEKTKTT